MRNYMRFHSPRLPLPPPLRDVVPPEAAAPRRPSLQAAHSKSTVLATKNALLPALAETGGRGLAPVVDVNGLRFTQWLTPVRLSLDERVPISLLSRWQRP